MTNDHPEKQEQPTSDQTPSLAKRLLKSTLRIVSTVVLIIGTVLFYCWYSMLHMPGESFSGEPPALTVLETHHAKNLEMDVTILATDYHHRNVDNPEIYAMAAGYLKGRLEGLGYEVTLQSYEDQRGVPGDNIIAELLGTELPDEIIVVGAHYDSVSHGKRVEMSTPGADDNASGVAATLALAGHYSRNPQKRTIRFVMFANEEPPWFHQEDMGSWVYAKSCRANNDNIIAMFSLETMGYFTDEPDSQYMPDPLSRFYPSTGNFITLVGNYSSRGLVKDVVSKFREVATVPSEGASPMGDFSGVSFSDHWSFWQEGYPALMVTDTAFLRYGHYHGEEDTPDKLDYPAMSRVVTGLIHVLDYLAN